MNSVDYNIYLEMKSTPPGAVLRHIIKRLRLSQSDLATAASMRPQRIYDLITGSRKFTPETSFKIEKALNINIPGFFYMIQTSYLIYKQIISSQQKPDLSKFRKIVFWDADIDKIDWEANRKWVINRIAEYGNETEMKEIEIFYGKDQVKEILSTNKTTRREKTSF